MSEAEQKQQRHERSVRWRKSLRRCNDAQHDRQSEARRKRSARLMTSLHAPPDADACTTTRWCPTYCPDTETRLSRLMPRRD